MIWRSHGTDGGGDSNREEGRRLDHQCRHRSASKETVLLGPEEARTRLKTGGGNAIRNDRQNDRQVENSPTNELNCSHHADPEDSQDQQHIASQYVDDLVSQALMHRATRHPYLTALSEGTLPDLRFALVDFARHYYGYSAHLPRYLTALISRLENPDHRNPLLANLIQESGHYEPEELEGLHRCGIEADWIVGVPHPELFQRFRHALGVIGTDPSVDHVYVVAWRDLLLSLLSSGSPAEALGALGLGSESIVPAIYQPFLDAIDRLGRLEPRDTVFFPLRTAINDQRQARIKAIAIDFAMTPGGRADLSKGMHTALALRNSFWDWLYERVLWGGGGPV